MSALIDLAPADEGRATLVPVRAQPGARRTGPQGAWNRMLKLAVTAPPDGGRANDELALLLAEVLGLRPSAVTLVRGARSRAKVFRVESPMDRVRASLAKVLD